MNANSMKDRYRMNIAERQRGPHHLVKGRMEAAWRKCQDRNDIGCARNDEWFVPYAGPLPTRLREGYPGR